MVLHLVRWLCNRVASPPRGHEARVYSSAGPTRVSTNEGNVGGD